MLGDNQFCCEHVKIEVLMGQPGGNTDSSYCIYSLEVRERSGFKTHSCELSVVEVMDLDEVT